MSTHKQINQCVHTHGCMHACMRMFIIMGMLHVEVRITRATKGQVFKHGCMSRRQTTVNACCGTLDNAHSRFANGLMECQVKIADKPSIGGNMSGKDKWGARAPDDQIRVIHGRRYTHTHAVAVATRGRNTQCRPYYSTRDWQENASMRISSDEVPVRGSRARACKDPACKGMQG